MLTCVLKMLTVMFRSVYKEGNVRIQPTATTSVKCVAEIQASCSTGWRAQLCPAKATASG